MTSKLQLTEGVLHNIMIGEEVKDPILQVLGTKIVTGTNQSDKARYRLLLSDGKYYISYAMLTVPKSADGKSGQVADNTIIKITNYMTSVLNSGTKDERRVLVILNMEVLVDGECIDKIGNPVVYSEKAATAEAAKLKSTAAGPTSAQPASKMTLPPMAQHNSSISDRLTNPISSLSPYHNKWVIKARVMTKSNIRTWSNSKGEGKLFSLDLVDESGEIRATVFRDLVDKFYDLIEVDKVYYISKATLKVANKQFSSIKNDFEMTFTNETIVEECHDDIECIPKTQYNFIGIDKITNIEVGTLLDVIGICKSTSDVVTINSKNTGRDLKKRELMLVDTSNCAIALTLWNNDAEQFDGSTNPVVAVKGAKVGEFGGGKNISLIGGSQMKLNPDIPQAHDLRGWFDNGGCQGEVSNISAKTGSMSFDTQWMSFKQVQENGLGNSEKGDYYQVLGTVLMIRTENAIYKSCPTDNCNKKLVDLANGMFKCEKCNREYPNYDYRLLLQMNVGDWSGNCWISVFNDDAELILGMTAKELGDAMAADSDAIADITSKAHFKQFIFKCRAKMETYNDETRLKTVAVKVSPVGYKEHNAYLISRVQELTSAL